MFDFILSTLVANNKDALGALFLDGTGETVDLVCSDYQPYEMKVVGAYLGIYLRRFEKLLAGSNLGDLRVLHIEKRGLHIFVVPLPDGYCLALVQRHPALIAQARASLDEAVDQLKRELFP